MTKTFQCQKCRKFFPYEENPEFPEEKPVICPECWAKEYGKTHADLP